MKAEKIIVKREPEGNYIIFFPYDDGNDTGTGTMLCYTYKDGHNEASYSYYLECTPVDYTDETVAAFVCNYVKYVRTLPDMQDYTIKMVKRIRR